jgi:LysM repeat protein
MAVLAGLAVLVAAGLAWSRLSQHADRSGGVPPADAVPRRPGPSQPAPGTVALHYTVAAGDTLGAIAERFGVDVATLVAGNQLADPDNLVVGQQLVIHAAPAGEGPATRLVPDTELVNGPAYRGFDPAGEVARWGGQLAVHSELVNGRLMTGPEILAEVSRDFSVGPRVLLAILEARGGWVTGGVADPGALAYPAGLADPARSGLWRQLNWLADRLNGGYYDWKTRDSRLMTLADGRQLAGHPSLNPGSFAVQRALAAQVSAAELPAVLADFRTAYRALFLKPGAEAAETEPAAAGPVSAASAFPPLQLPFARGETWWLTGGPHGGWADGSAWSAMDLVPEEPGRGCFTSTRWARAAADGVVVGGGDGQLWLDLDGDGDARTGPVLFYMHLAAEGRAPPGQRVRAGDPLGRPSCEGGASNATHLHLARLLDGEWLPAAGAAPLTLGGWRASGGPAPYEGALSRNGTTRGACECREPGTNDITW